MMEGPPFPKAQPNASRRDAYPGGRPAGSSLSFMQKQHLDPNNVALGVLNPLNTGKASAIMISLPRFARRSTMADRQMDS